jgi:hypothetical protein
MSVQAIGWVLENSKSSNTARCVLISIANHLGGDGSGWVYVDRICREANCSLNSYHRAIQWAVDNGELERVEHAGGYDRTHERHRPNLFRFPALSECGTHFGGEGGTQNGGEGGTQNGEVNRGAVSRTVSKAKTNVDLGVSAVFAAWCEATGRDAARTKLTKDRRRKIEQRLGEGFSIQDLTAAVQGVALSPFHMGENDRRQKYDDIVTVLRDGSQVEKFRDLSLQGPVKSRPKSFGAIMAAVESAERGVLNELA